MKALVLLLALLTGCGGCASVPDYNDAKASVVRLEFPGGGVCSGTAVSKTTVLSAAHCFHVDSGDMSVNGKDVTFKVIANDGEDHVLVTVDKPFAVWARMAIRKPAQGDVVFVHGNPAALKDILLTGRVSGRWDDLLLLDLNAWYGVSGAAVFNEDGQIIGVVSRMVPGDQAYWRLTGCYDIKFTAKQWAEAGV
ncbi:MAG TPA: serine protease [Lysobacter sp.]